MAGIFYYLNRTGFNGLCRFNSKGLYNVPFGRYKSINYKREYREYAEFLRKIEITNHSFEDIAFSDGDFLYCDPPYDTPFTSYSKEDFKWEDQVKLIKFLIDLNLPVVISNQATKRITELYSDYGFNLKTLDAPRRISCDGNRESTKEVLAYRGLSGKK